MKKLAKSTQKITSVKLTQQQIDVLDRMENLMKSEVQRIKSAN